MGLYLVHTDRWYTERAVYGIAGAVVLSNTLLAAVVDVRFAVFVLITALFSWLDALTGFCVVSTALNWAGMPSRLPAPGPAPRVLGLPIYIARTDAWYLERGIYAVVGTTLSLASFAAMTWTPWWLLFTGFVGSVAIGFAFTGFCPIANVLYGLGFEPRLGAWVTLRDAVHPAGAPHGRMG